MRWQGNWIHRGEKRPANPVTRFPVGETPRRGKGCTRQNADLTPHRYPDRQSAACVILLLTLGHTFGVRVQRVHKVQRVQRGRLTALRAEGCGRLSAAGYVRFRSGGDSPNGLRVVVAASPQFLKSALRDLLSVSYGMISILRTGSLRSPPPFRLRRTSPFAGGRIGFYAFLQRHGGHMAKHP